MAFQKVIWMNTFLPALLLVLLEYYPTARNSFSKMTALNNFFGSYSCETGRDFNTWIAISMWWRLKRSRKSCFIFFASGTRLPLLFLILEFLPIPMIEPTTSTVQICTNLQTQRTIMSSNYIDGTKRIFLWHSRDEWLEKFEKCRCNPEKKGWALKQPLEISKSWFHSSLLGFSRRPWLSNLTLFDSHW